MRRRLWKKIAACMLATAMVLTLFPTPEVQAKEGSVVEYEIYPQPQKVTYSDRDFIIRKDVNVVYEDGIDKYTKQKVQDVLKNKGISAPSVTEKIDKKKTNILIGIKGSEGYVEQYAKEKKLLDDTVFQEHLNPYVLDVNENVITIVGKDTDAAFYGVVSLMHILNQLDGRTIRNLRIEDYADTKTRGFIEGYYGLPWSNADRMSLMEFGGQFKMTSYIFAPKDDPYHSSQWRTPYPEDKLAEIAEMAEVGNANKCRFVWTIHPFMYGGMTEATYDADIEAIKAKFEQLYQAGVRQFGVLADDAGNLPRTVIVRAMNDLQKWVDSKKDVYNLVFCPGGYNDSWQKDYSELNQYDDGFPEDIQIFWTGQAVCQPVEQLTLNNFRRKNLPQGAEDRRSPLFWLNWPVNDINMNRLLMGEGTLLHNDVNVEDLSGVVTNPMQDAEPSKVAIFAVADYAWNVSSFDSAESWKDSFKYVEPDAAAALYELAKHMSDPSPNGHWLVLEESKELQPLLDGYAQALESSAVTKEQENTLIEEFEKIVNACDEFEMKCKNERMKEQVTPFSDSLRDQAEAAIAFIETEQAIEKGNVSEVWKFYSQATAKLADSKTHLRPKLQNGQKVMTNALPGSKRITPFLNKVNELVSPTVNSMIDENKIITSLITNRTDTPDGALDKITDGKDSTIVTWQNPNTLAKDTYIGLRYSKPIHLEKVTFKMGADNPRDTFDAGKLQYTEDGTTWLDLAGTEYTDTRAEITAENLNLQIRGIRLISTAETPNRWLSCKEIEVNKTEETQQPQVEKLAGTGVYNEELMVVRNGNIGMMTDGAVDKSGNNYIGFSKSNEGGDPDKDKTVVGAYVGLQFEEPVTVGRFVVSQGTGDHISKGKLEYQNEKNEWVEIKSYDNIGEDFDETFSPVKAKAIRLVNTEIAAIWWRVYEAEAYAGDDAEDTEPLNKTIIKTPIWTVYDGQETNLTDGNEDSIVWYNTGKNAEEERDDDTLVGDYLGMDLGRVTKVGVVEFVVGQNENGDKWEKYKLEYSAADVAAVDQVPADSWKTYKEYTGVASGKDVHQENLNGIEARYVRLVNQQKKHAWVKFGEFNVEKYKKPSGDNPNVYTNVDALKKLETENEMDRIAFAPVKKLTLQAGEYVGVVFDRIRNITDIQVDTTETLKLESSLNGVVWTTVKEKSFEDARYVRVINDTKSAVTFDLNTFVVETYEIEPISVEDTNFGSYDGGDHLNAFDKDRTTQAMYTGSQTQGLFITYDLGQKIDLQTLKIVLHDGMSDFPRHAKVSVSADNKTWKEVMLIGAQDGPNAGEAENQDNIADLFPVHETSYYTKETTNINTQARYVKFEITRTKAGDNKWVRINEIELNGGQLYLPEVNDPTIVGENVTETDGNVLVNMIDGEVSTTYQCESDKAGSFTYRLSDRKNVTKLVFLQSPNTISNAEVTAEVMQDGQIKTVTLGTLNTSMNEFNTSAFEHVLSVTVSWEAGKAPEIHEILTSTGKVAAVDKETLRTYYNDHKEEDTSAWTPESVKIYREAVEFAKSVLDSEYATQAMVNTALAELREAVGNKVEKADMNAFADKVKEITDKVIAEENYLPRTWIVYAERLAAAEAAKENENISQAELDELLKNLQSAANGLVYEVNSIEELQVLLSDVKEYDLEVDYAENSLAELKEAIKAGDAMVAADAEVRQNPKDVKAALTRLEKAAERFHAWTALENTLKEAKDIDITKYTPVSVKKLQDAIKAAEALNDTETTTNENIAEAITALQEAIKGMTPVEETSGVLAEIERLEKLPAEEYTEESYADLQTVLTEVKAELEAGKTEYKAYLEKMKKAENGLVSIIELKNVVDAAKEMDLSIYTETSQNSLNSKVAEAEALYQNGTKKTIEEMIKSLQETIEQMILTVEYVQTQTQEYVDVLEGNYTTSSREILQKTLDEVTQKAQDEVLTRSLFAEYQAKLQEQKELLIDTTELLAAINQAEQVKGDGYTSVSFKKYTNLIARAKELLENGKVTEIADAVNALNHPEEVLVKRGDFGKLQSLVSEYKNMDLSGYTKESADNLKAELMMAEFMIQQGDYGQDQIDAQAEAIKVAVKALKKVTENSSASQQSGGDKTPTTGDAKTPVFWVAMLILSGFVLVERDKRRRFHR